MNDPNCLFCKIVGGKIESTRVYENADFMVIRDIQPQARVHLLVIPKMHVRSLADIPAGEHGSLLSGLLSTAARVAEERGLSERGYRTVINTREWGGQTVGHLHLHLLGGELLKGRFA